MPSVQIKDVPEDTHPVLRRRAAEAHQSLQDYLRSQLIEQASSPTVNEVLARAGERAKVSARAEVQARGGITLVEAAKAIRQDRDSR
jgi:plasmid stability protein